MGREARQESIRLVIDRDYLEIDFPMERVACRQIELMLEQLENGKVGTSLDEEQTLVFGHRRHFQI